MDLREAVAKLFTAKFLLAILEFFAIAGFTQLLGTGAIGSFFLFQAVIGIIGIPGDLGVSRAAEKALSAGDSLGEVLSSTILVKLLLLTPWLIALWPTAPFVEQYVGQEGIVPLIALGLFVNQSRRLVIRLLAGQMKVEQTAIIRVLGKVVWLGVGFGLIQVGGGAKSVVVGFIAGEAMVVFISMIRLELAFDQPTLERARSLVTFGRYVFIGSVGGFAYSWMDVAILRFFVSPSLIGVYEVAWRVASLSMMVTLAVRESLFPQISQWYTDGNTEKISDAFYTWLQPPLYLTIPALAGAIVLGNEVLNVLFGVEELVGYYVLVIFMIEKIIRSVHMILSPSLFAIDKPELGYRGSLVAIIINLILNISLIPIFGLYGAAVATTLGALSSAIVNASYISRFVPISLPWSRLLWSVICSGIMGAIVFFLAPLFPKGVIRLAISVTTGVFLYLVLLLANPDIRIEIKSIIQELSSATD